MTIRWSVAIGAPIFLSILWHPSVSPALADSSPIVHIKNGTLEGTTMKSRSGRDFAVFLGIPYAEPPVGELRFAPPKPSIGWGGVRPAKEECDVCTQRNVYLHQAEVVGVEDCLCLNIYAPKLPSNEVAHRSKYPVVVFFHGGGWVCNTGGRNVYGPQNFLDHDMVFVSPNYRLGPLGFLSTEDTASLGNQALKDQTQSLRWVQENVAAFGGDPDMVTIFGESAGAASVHLHVVSPLSRGLFHRAISQSGTAICPWSLHPKPGLALNQAKQIGKLLNCPTHQSKALIECLRGKNATDIVATDRYFQVFDVCPAVPYRAVIEPDHPGAFLIEEPAQSLKSGNVADVPWLTGVNSHEGAIKAAPMFELKDKNYDKLYDEKFMELAPISLLYEPSCPEKFRDNVTRSIRKFYFDNNKIDIAVKWKVIDLYTDRFFFIPTYNSIRLHLEALSAPVYFYFFAYKGNYSYSTFFGGNRNDYGVSHADNIMYLFPNKAIPKSEYNADDLKMADVLTRLCFNFIKTGNPTPEKTSLIPLKWKPVRTSRLEFFHIRSPTNMSMDSNLFPDRVKFWDNLPHIGFAQIRQELQREKDEL